MHALCQVCGKRPATIHLTEPGTTAGGHQEAHLCPQCVERLELKLETSPPPLAELLLKSKIVEAAASEKLSSASDDDGLRCDSCGFAFADYANHNLFGCPACYESFGAKAESLIRRHHGAVRHAGRVPAPKGTVLVADDQDGNRVRRIRLEAELKEAVTAERFERVAELRDELRHLGGLP